MTHRMLPHRSVFVVLVLLVLLVSPIPHTESHTEQLAAKYLLIRRSSVFFGEDDTPSRALLITDPDEIRKVHALMTASEYTGHTCGFDWSASFWASPSEAVDGFSINEACDRYDPQLKSYFDQLRDRPTHFIYSLKIPVHIHPKQVIDDLEERGLTVFLMDGAHPHLPSVQASVSPPEENGKQILTGSAQSGEARLRSIVEELAEEYPVMILGKVYCPDYHYKGQPGCSAQVTVWFEQGADLTGIGDKVESLGGRTWGKGIPLEYYHVQLVVEVQDLEKLQQGIVEELDYVIDVTRHDLLPASRSASGDTLDAEPSEEWEIESIDTEGNVGWDTALALGEADYPHISYKPYDGGLKYAYQDASGWHIGMVDDTRYAGGDNSLALDDHGHAHISYYVGGDRVLKYAYQDTRGWHAETVDNSEYVGTDSSLALGASGLPHISYCDQENDDLKFAYKDASGWHIETVDNGGDVGWATSLALDADGYAHISYLDWGNGDLKYAYQDASGWHIKAVDADAREHTSLALDGSGHPHIGYYGSRSLKYAYQDAGGWHIEMVDDVGEPGWYTSLVLDSSGSPHLSYNDRAGFDLKYRNLARISDNMLKEQMTA